VTVARSWPALSAWGAGLTHLAVAAGSPWWILVPLCVAAACQFAWGFAVFRTGRVVLPQIALYGAVGLVLASLWMTLAGWIGIGPLAAITLLLLYVAASAGAALRRSERPRPRGNEKRALLGILLGSLLVASITTPALSLTGAGSQAVPHGELPDGHAH
jgi:hypothetical protein